MWNRRDWDDFFNILKKRGPKHLPLRPVDRLRPNRLVPADGYSLAELDDAGLSIEQAENLGLPVDAGRVGAYGPNVSSLREFIRASRTPPLGAGHLETSATAFLTFLDGPFPLTSHSVTSHLPLAA